MVQTTWQDDDERYVIENVQQYGWHVATIEDDPSGPAFAYSIGLYHTLKQPEIIIFGLSGNTAAQIINVIGEEMRQGTTFKDWQENDRILEGHLCMFRHVDEGFYPDYLGFAMWFYRPDDFPVLQCVWPDRHGRYPWHPEVSTDFFRNQPVLAREHPWRFSEGKNRGVFTTKRVLDGTHSILLVSHDEEGDWQFLCGTTNRAEDGRIVSLEYVIEQHPAITELADLPVGWRAMRDGPDQPRRRVKSEPQGEE
jgi:hypothetical protein